MSIVNSNISNTGLVEKYVGTAYDTVKKVADNIDDVITLAGIQDLSGIAGDLNNSVILAQTAASESEASNQAAQAVESTVNSDAAASALSASNASISEIAARNSELAAAQSQIDASNSANVAIANLAGTQANVDFASKWASEAEDVLVDDGIRQDFSAFHYAQKASAVAASGESNTAANVGTGAGLFLQKTLVNLEFKSLKATGFGNITSDADSVTVNVTANHADLGNVNAVNSHTTAAITGLDNALASKASLSSPIFLGTPLAPTANAGTNTVQIATTAFVQGEKNSPNFTGIPLAPTASIGTATTQIATTEFVENAKTSPTFTGTPNAPTPVAGDNSTLIATTEFVQNEKISPSFIGTPDAPTAAVGTNTTQIATTGFVQGEKASPAFTGTPTAPTAASGTNTTQLATTGFVQQELSSFQSAPTGSISAMAVNIVPTGHLECDGSAVSRTTYADLFSAIGTVFGSGDGTTTFGLPDLRGEFIRGFDNGRGVDSGRTFGSSQSDDFKSHTHTKDSYGPEYSGAFTGVKGLYPNTSGTNTGATGGSETRPRNIALMYIIKI